jgi:hypothetical protein
VFYSTHYTSCRWPRWKQCARYTSCLADALCRDDPSFHVEHHVLYYNLMSWGMTLTIILPGGQRYQLSVAQCHWFFYFLAHLDKIKNTIEPEAYFYFKEAPTCTEITSVTPQHITIPVPSLIFPVHLGVHAILRSTSGLDLGPAQWARNATRWSRAAVYV